MIVTDLQSVNAQTFICFFCLLYDKDNSKTKSKKSRVQVSFPVLEKRKETSAEDGG